MCNSDFRHGIWRDKFDLGCIFPERVLEIVWPKTQGSFILTALISIGIHKEYPTSVTL